MSACDSVEIVRVLLVEDDPIAVKIERATLLEMDCKVDVAMSGAEALRKVSRDHYDIIFMDLGLHDMDGFSIALALRESEGPGCHVPIVALTAHTERTYRERCLQAGMNGFLSKPLTSNMVRTMIHRFCDELLV